MQVALLHARNAELTQGFHSYNEKDASLLMFQNCDQHRKHSLTHWPNNISRAYSVTEQSQQL